MLLACISPPCVSLLAIILNAREISCTKEECCPLPLQGPRAHRVRQLFLSLWPLMEKREVLCQFVAFLRHCPYLSVIRDVCGVEGASAGISTRLGLTRRAWARHNAR